MAYELYYWGACGDFYGRALSPLLILRRVVRARAYDTHRRGFGLVNVASMAWICRERVRGVATAPRWPSARTSRDPKPRRHLAPRDQGPISQARGDFRVARHKDAVGHRRERRRPLFVTCSATSSASPDRRRRRRESSSKFVVMPWTSSPRPRSRTSRASASRSGSRILPR